MQVHLIKRVIKSKLGFLHKDLIMDNNGCFVSRKAPAVGGSHSRSVLHFSQASRRRFFSFLVRKNMVPDGFLTLTFPASFPSGLVANHDFLRKYLQFGKRRGYRFIWRLEAQLRGAPHYHILVFKGSADKFDSDLMRKKWISYMIAWNKEQKRKNRSKVKDIKIRAYLYEPLSDSDMHKVFLYVSKYCAKYKQCPVDKKTGEIYSNAFVTGRQWGKVGFKGVDDDSETVYLKDFSIDEYMSEVHGQSLTQIRSYHLFYDGECDIVNELINLGKKIDFREGLYVQD